MKPSIEIGLDSEWLVSLTSLEVYNSIFNKTGESNQFEVHTDLVDEFSFTELKDELEEFLDISNISSKHLQHDIVGPPIIKAYRKLGSEKLSSDGYRTLLMGYHHFEIFKVILESSLIWIKK